jgi:hypothetical protein
VKLPLSIRLGFQARDLTALLLFSFVFTFILSLSDCMTDTAKQNGHPLECTLSVPAHAGANSPLEIRMSIVNRDSASVTLSLGGNPPYRFSVLTDGNVPVWESTRGEPVQELLALQTLAPGESLVYTADWNLRDLAGQPVPRGTYTVRGWLEGDSSVVAEATPVHVVIE